MSHEYEYDPDPEWEANLLAAQKAADLHNTQWRAKWPKHCTKCGGWGGFSFTQRHDNGPGEPMFDICELDRAETCHRCGEDGLDSDANGPCKFCGWDFNDGLQEVM